MLFLVRTLSAVAVALVCSVLLGWTAPGYIKLGGLAAVVCAAIVASLMWMSRTKPVKGIRRPPSRLRELLIGCLSGVLWVGLVQIFFFVALNTTTLGDSDRGVIDRETTLHEDAGNYEAASEVCLTALSDPHTPEFTQSLAERAVLNLTRAADQSVGGDREVLLKRAIAVAVRYNVPADLPRLALRRLTDADSISGFKDQLDIANAQAAKTQAEHDRLLREQEAQAGEAERRRKAQADELSRRADGFNSSLRRMGSLALRHGASLSGNAIDGDVTAARGTLLSLMQETGAEDAAATAAVKKLDAVIAANLPADLPAGVTATIRRVDTSVMPGLSLLDVELVDSSRLPLLGLSEKDFSANQAGQKLRLSVAPISKSESLVTAILLDTSVSTNGAPISATRLAVPEFVNRLPTNTTVRLSSFSDQQKLLVDWTTDKGRVTSVVQSIRADGGTALRQAAYHEIHALAARSGFRVLVVFSDGADSLPGPTPEAIISAAKQAQVAVHFVALKGAGYSDTSVIERIARETGGKTFLVEDARKLSQSFELLAASLQETGYRLALLDHNPSSPCQLVIGGKKSVTLNVAPEATPNSVALLGTEN